MQNTCMYVTDGKISVASAKKFPVGWVVRFHEDGFPWISESKITKGLPTKVKLVDSKSKAKKLLNELWNFYQKRLDK